MGGVSSKFKFFKPKSSTSSFGDTDLINMTGVEYEMLETQTRNAIIKWRNVNLHKGNKTTDPKLINDLNLNIYHGETFALVGLKNSSKSTIAETLIDKKRKMTGEVLFDESHIDYTTKKQLTPLLRFQNSRLKYVKEWDLKKTNLEKNPVYLFKKQLKKINYWHWYIRDFDYKTLAGALKIYENQKDLPLLLENLSAEYIYDQLTHLKFKEVFQVIYKEIPSSIKDSKQPWAESLRHFLSVRSRQREKFYDGEFHKRRISFQLMINICIRFDFPIQRLNNLISDLDKLSKMKVLIANEFLNNPKLIIFDQVFESLSSNEKILILKAANNLAKFLDVTLFVIEENLREVQNIADRIGFIYKGTLVEVGPANQILNNPVHPYTKMLVSQTNSDQPSYIYDENIHDYILETPHWQKINKDWFVFGSDDEVSDWKNGQWKILKDEDIRY